MIAPVIKVCGVTTEADARMAIEAGATALGFNFYRKSPRYVPAADWMGKLAALKAGVFVDEDPAEVRRICREAGLDVAQIHRGESPVGVRIWRAVSIDDFRPQPEAECLVVDAPPLRADMPGGTGQTYDYARAAGLPGRIILAGGLDGANVGEAIRLARPYGVDAASRLELSPGRKDPRKVEAFVRAAQRAFAESEVVA